jgi:hypothetical protein
MQLRQGVSGTWFCFQESYRLALLAIDRLFRNIMSVTSTNITCNPHLPIMVAQ